MFSRRYDHQTEAETGGLFPQNISVVPSPGCNLLAAVFAFDCAALVFKAALQAGRVVSTLLLLDQIKPIEQLVPVS